VHLTIGGIVEARLWQSGAPWLDSVRAAQPYWFMRTLSAVPITLGFMALLLGLITGEKGAGLREVKESVGLEPIKEIAPRLAPAIARESL